MKMKHFSMLVLAAAGLLFANQAAAQMTKWKEMDAFHEMMAMTFHPAEEGDLAPVMEHAGDLVTRANEWKKSTPPSEFNKPEIKKNLALLAKESKSLQKMVKKQKSEAEIKQAIYALHDRFHTIMMECKH